MPECPYTRYVAKIKCMPNLQVVYVQTQMIWLNISVSQICCVHIIFSCCGDTVKWSSANGRMVGIVVSEFLSYL